MQQRAVRHPCLAACDMLALAPPARHLDRISRVVDVDDLQDVAVIAFRQPGHIDITPTIVIVAMRALTAGLELAEDFRILGIVEAPDLHTLAIGL